MSKAGSIAGVFLFSALAFVMPGSWAQLVASRDLTSGWRVPQEHVPGPSSDSCPKVSYSVTPGDMGKKAPAAEGERLELQIMQISPPQLTIGEDFIATVQLKNAGTTTVLVPATADGAQLPGNAIQDEKTEEEYEVADVSFRLATGKDHRTPIFLSSAGALFADPDDKNSYVTLAPGNWVQIKLKGVVECGAAKCLAALQADSDGVLTAWWYQRLLTHKVSGCEENHGSIDVREVDSTPFRVVVHNSVKKAENSPAI
ncbi:MAG TPA: hypothetical protein VF133_08780 [Terriglobales bacterium]